MDRMMVQSVWQRLTEEMHFEALGRAEAPEAHFMVQAPRGNDVRGNGVIPHLHTHTLSRAGPCMTASLAHFSWPQQSPSLWGAHSQAAHWRHWMRPTLEVPIITYHPRGSAMACQGPYALCCRAAHDLHSVVPTALSNRKTSLQSQNCWPHIRSKVPAATRRHAQKRHIQHHPAIVRSILLMNMHFSDTLGRTTG